MEARQCESVCQKEYEIEQIDEWEESVKLFQRQTIFSRQELRRLTPAARRMRNNIGRSIIRGNLWSGQRKRQGVE